MQKFADVGLCLSDERTHLREWVRHLLRYLPSAFIRAGLLRFRYLVEPFCSYAARSRNGLATTCLASFLAVNAIMSRVVPVITMLMPTSVPMTHNELTGHCSQIMKPRIKVMIPSTSTQPEWPLFRVEK